MPYIKREVWDGVCRMLEDQLRAFQSKLWRYNGDKTRLSKKREVLEKNMKTLRQLLVTTRKIEPPEKENE